MHHPLPPRAPSAPPLVRLDEELPRRREAAPRARAVLADALGPGAAHPELALVVTELVANAVRHGRGRKLLLRIEADHARAVVEVVNRSTHLRPRRRLASRRGLTGRGLVLVAALSTRWGAEPAPRGRARVWAEVPLPEPPLAGRASPA